MTDLTTAYRDALLALPFDVRKAYASGHAFQSDPAAKSMLRAFHDVLDGWKPTREIDQKRLDVWQKMRPLQRERVADILFVALITNRRSEKMGMKDSAPKRLRSAATATADRVVTSFEECMDRDDDARPSAPSCGGWT